MAPRELVGDEALGLQLVVGGHPQVHLAEGGVAEAFADHGLEGGGRRGAVDYPTLRHPLGACLGVVVEAQTGVEGEALHEVLADGHVGGHLVLVLIADGAGLLARLATGVPGVAVDVLVVETEGEASLGPEAEALVGGEAREGVVAAEVVVGGGAHTVVVISVVDLVAPEVVVDAEGARGAAVAVGERGGGGTAVDPLAGLQQGTVGGAGIGGGVVGEVGVGRDLPLRTDVVAELDLTAVLVEAHVGTVVVGARALQRDDAPEASLAQTAGGVGLDGAVGAGAEVDVGPDAVAEHLAGDDVEDAAHGIGTVEHGGGTAQHLHALGEHGLVEVGGAVAEEALILGHAVDEHHEAAAGTADAAQGDGAGGAVADAVAEDATAGDEEAGHLLREGGQDVLLLVLGERGVVHGGDRHGHVAEVALLACAGDHHVGERVGQDDEEGCEEAGHCASRSTRV